MTLRIRRFGRNRVDEAQRALERAEADLLKAEADLLESVRSRGGSDCELEFLRTMFRKIHAASCTDR